MEKAYKYNSYKPITITNRIKIIELPSLIVLEIGVSIVGSLRDREVACSASDRQGSNFESCVWRTVSSHYPQEVLLAQFSLYVLKGGLKPDSFHFIRDRQFISHTRRTKPRGVFSSNKAKRSHLTVMTLWFWQVDLYTETML